MAPANTPLLLLLFLLAPAAIREYLTASRGLPPEKDASSTVELHPIILLAGLGCSDLEARLTEAYRPSLPRCGAMKGKGWFGLWSNITDLQERDYMPCFLEQMRLVYDPAANDYWNLAGVETRVTNFGSARAFHDKNPLTPKQCLANFVEALEELGYRDGDTLFGAPYDWRYAPPVPGQASRAYSPYFRRLKALIEAASVKHRRKVIIAAHSYGGMVALEFVRRAPPAWRDRHVKHLILVTPTLSVGITRQVQSLVSQSARIIYVPPAAADDSSVRTLWRSFETAVVDMPSPAVFGHDAIVVTGKKNYTAHDMQDLFADVGFGDGVEPFVRRMVPKMLCVDAPMVPLTCINGVGIRTPRQLVFREISDYDVLSPEFVYGDGDGVVNLESMAAFDEEMHRQPWQRRRFKSVKIHNVQHSAIVTEPWAVKKVVEEVIEANRNSL